MNAHCASKGIAVLQSYPGSNSTPPDHRLVHARMDCAVVGRQLLTVAIGLIQQFQIILVTIKPVPLAFSDLGENTGGDQQLNCLASRRFTGCEQPRY